MPVPATEPVKLSFWLGNYPNTAALKNGTVKSDIVAFDFPEVQVANRGFKSIVRDAKYDVGELAIGTYLQAKAYDKPYVLLPAVAMARGQHHTIAYNPERGLLRPSDLNGRRVGVRAYTQTTGAWLRGMLADDYGVDVDSVRWITFEDPHLAEYRDPEIVERAPAGKELVQMLLDGELDAAIVGDSIPDDRLKPLIPDPDAAARKWAESHGGMPINHMIVVRDSISKSRPDVVQDIFRMLRDSKRAAKLPESGTALDPLRFGVDSMRKSLEIIIDFCVRQRLIPRRFTVDELFDNTTRALGR
jgi:4,5-dihydroxyphthalate decarboxylase